MLNDRWLLPFLVPAAWAFWPITPVKPPETGEGQDGHLGQVKRKPAASTVHPVKSEYWGSKQNNQSREAGCRTIRGLCFAWELPVLGWLGLRIGGGNRAYDERFIEWTCSGPAFRLFF